MPRNKGCTLCPLHKSAQNPCVWGEGPEDAEVMVVGEAPNSLEDERERPALGESGKLIRKELAEAGFDNVYFTNVVKCRPPDKHTPTPAEAKVCLDYLADEVSRVKPRYVITLGALASKVVLKKAAITQVHGEILEGPHYTAMPIYSPKYALYDMSKLPAITHDLARFKRFTEGKVQEEVKWEVLTSKNLRWFLREFQETNEFSFDVETSSLNWFDPAQTIRCLGIGLPKRSWVIPLDMPESPFEGQIEKATPLMRMLRDLARDKSAVGQNAKFDNHWLWAKFGITFHLDFDCMLAHHVLDENQAHDLEYMARVELDAPRYDIPLAEKKGGRLHLPEGRHSFFEYNAKDTWYTLRLYRTFRKRLREDHSLYRLFYRLVMPAARALQRIEQNGLTLDLAKYAEVEKRVKGELAAQLDKLQELAIEHTGKVLNWNSPKQVANFLYEVLSLECVVYTDKGAPSTGEEALLGIKGTHPVADELIKYRELERFVSTYLDGWKEYTIDGKLYLSYKLHGTVTGRYSSRLHSVPRDGTIRNLVVAPPGWEFCQADLSQAELRIAAQLSGDLELINCFRPGGADVHWRTVMHTIGTGASDATEELLETAKLYCLQQEVPASRAGCEVLRKVWETYPNRERTSALLEFCRKVGKDKATGRWKRWSAEKFRQSLLEGRRLPVPIETMEEKMVRALWKYSSLSSSSQGSRSLKQSEIQFSDALSLVSCLTPSVAQELSKGWKEWRKRGKSVNFGFVYGMYERKFIETCKLKYGYEPTYDEAHAFRQAYFELYVGIPKWHEKQKRLVKLDGFVRNMFGRMRRLPSIYSTDKGARMEAERQAINSPVQGVIGDWKAAALVEIHETIDRKKLKIVGEHHDALLMIVKKGCEDEVLPKVRKIMRKPALLDTFKIKMSVPMESEIELGPWGAGRSYKDPT